MDIHPTGSTHSRPILTQGNTIFEAETSTPVRWRMVFPLHRRAGICKVRADEVASMRAAMSLLDIFVISQLVHSPKTGLHRGFWHYQISRHRL